MITKFFFDLALTVGGWFLNLLPDIGFSVPSGVWGLAADCLNMVGYLLPVGTINTIIGLLIDLALFRIGVSFIRFIWKFIPILGS